MWWFRKKTAATKRHVAQRPGRQLRRPDIYIQHTKRREVRERGNRVAISEDLREIEVLGGQDVEASGIGIQMRVAKRDGTLEPVDLNKIVRAVARCAAGRGQGWLRSDRRPLVRFLGRTGVRRGVPHPAAGAGGGGALKARPRCGRAAEPAPKPARQ